jgi:hypothetical protein
MNFFEKLGQVAANNLVKRAEGDESFSAEDVLASKGPGAFLADYLGGSTAMSRAGRGRAVAKALGVKTPFTVERPVVSGALHGAVGSGLGAGAGTLLAALLSGSPDLAKRNMPAAGALGAVGGGLLGMLDNRHKRHKELANLSENLQDHLDVGAPLDTSKKPTTGLANFLPIIGPGRYGETHAHLQLKNKDKAPVLGGIPRYSKEQFGGALDALTAAAMTHPAGALTLPLTLAGQSAQGWDAKHLLDTEAKDEQRAKRKKELAEKHKKG